MSSRLRRVGTALLTTGLLALAVPVLALAAPPAREAGTGRGGGGGGLAATGFDAWKIGLLGVLCLAAALFLAFRSRAERA